MITQAHIKQLKQYLEQTLVICNDMIKTREFNKLFTSEKDFRDSKIACKVVPDVYYRCRLFDVEIELRYNQRTKRYYIYCECANLPFSLKEINQESEFKDKFFEYHRPSSASEFVFNADINFDNAVFLYKEFLRYFLFKSEGDYLFDIY